MDANEPRTWAGFADRSEAGTRLGDRLAAYRGKDVLVLGIPRGGVPVADAVARRLDADLDILAARKVGSAHEAEYAIGAVTANSGEYWSDEAIAETGATPAYIAFAAERERARARQQERQFREDRSAAAITGRVVVIVDDGLATGATMRAAIRSVRAERPSRIVVAVPVGARETCAALRQEADEVVCLYEPDPFYAVGLHYRSFPQVADSEVQRILRDASQRKPHTSSSLF